MIDNVERFSQVKEDCPIYLMTIYVVRTAFLPFDKNSECINTLPTTLVMPWIIIENYLKYSV